MSLAWLLCNVLSAITSVMGRHVRLNTMASPEQNGLTEKQLSNNERTY